MNICESLQAYGDPGKDHNPHLLLSLRNITFFLLLCLQMYKGFLGEIYTLSIYTKLYFLDSSYHRNKCRACSRITASFCTCALRQLTSQGPNVYI